MAIFDFSNLEKRWMENHEEIFSAFQRIFPIGKTVNGKPWKNIFCFSKKFIVLSIYEILSSSIFLSIGGSFLKGFFSKNNICNFITINFFLAMYDFFRFRKTLKWKAMNNTVCLSWSLEEFVINFENNSVVEIFIHWWLVKRVPFSRIIPPISICATAMCDISKFGKGWVFILEFVVALICCVLPDESRW